MRIAIVVPTLNEEPALRCHLRRLLDLEVDVVVSDGGSSDGSCSVARAMGARLTHGPAGRGGQLDRGARLAMEDRPDILLFLHADTVLPDNAIDRIVDTIAGGAVGGGFLVRFDDRRPLLRLGERLINLRTRLLRVPLGDQAQFLTRTAYQSLGGYKHWPILEDLDLVRRLRGQGRIAIVTTPVTTGARRFVQGGILRTVTKNWLIWILFLVGVSPDRLARLYRHAR
jgi:rSAM/selenodomain-associated transferase 2